MYLVQLSLGPEAQHFREKKIDLTIFEKVHVEQSVRSRLRVTNAVVFNLPKNS